MNKLWFVRQLDLFEGMSEGEGEGAGTLQGPGNWATSSQIRRAATFFLLHAVLCYQQASHLGCGRQPALWFSG